MSTRVRLPDGRTVTVQTDDHQQATAAARRYLAANPAPRALPTPPPRSAPRAKPTPRGAWGTFTDFAGDMLDNAVPNFGDEVAGFGGGIGSMIQGRGYMPGYERQSRIFREHQRQYDRDHPNLAWASTIAGAADGALIPAGRLARANTAGQRVRQGAGVGAAYGALSGAGEGQGLIERGTNALVGAGEGAVLGAALPPLISGVHGTLRGARRYIPGADVATRTLAAVPRAIASRLGASTARTAGVEQADRTIAEQMRTGNITNGFGQPGAPSSPMTIAQEVERRNRVGVPAMVGDVSDNMRGLTEYASRGVGPGQSMVRRALDERKATEGLRVRQHVQDTFPTVQDPLQYIESVQREAREAAAPLYRRAYDQPVYRTDAIQGIEQTPAFRQALPQAYQNIRNQIDPLTGRPKSPEAMGFRQMDADPNGLPPNGPSFPHPDGNGFVSYENGLSTEGYDQVTRAMRDNARAAGEVNPLTGEVRNNSNSVHINARAGELRHELMDQNAPYHQAVQGYGDDMTYANAFDQGGDVGSLTGHEVNAQRRALPEPAHQAWATGAGTAMADEASQYAARYPAGSTANRVRQMLGDEPKRQAIGDVRGDPSAVRELLDRLEYEQQGHLNWQGVNGNSRTAQRQQMDSDLDSAFVLPTSKAAAVGRFVNWLATKSNPRFHRELRSRIAEVVTASGAQDVQAALRAIEAQAERDANFTNLLHRSGIAATAVIGSTFKPVNPTDDPYGDFRE